MTIVKLIQALSRDQYLELELFALVAGWTRAYDALAFAFLDAQSKKIKIENN